MEDIHILLVDDKEENRDRIKEGLIKMGFHKNKIQSVSSGEEAEILVQSAPGHFDVAVIDQRLKEDGIDGIKTTKRICTHERDIFPIIFTNAPSDNPDTIEKFRARAYEAGAYRYMHWKSPQNELILVNEFVNEISQLRQLQKRVHTFYETQRYTPSLLTQLNIMVILVDRGYKIWYMNEEAKKFQAQTEIPRQACANTFLGDNIIPPCRGCIADKTFKDGQNHERIYLHPLVGADKKLKWIYSWTQPMPDEKGEPILLDDGKPIAVLESTQDLTDSHLLRNMGLKERMQHIALSLHEHHNGFDRVRIYEADEKGEQLNLIAWAGYPRDIETARVEDKNPPGVRVQDYPVLEGSIRHYRKTGEGKFNKKVENHDPVYPDEFFENLIHWPLMKGERIMGLLSVSSIPDGRPCTIDALDIVKDYAEEALQAFASKEREQEIPDIEKITAEIDGLIIRQITPESRLQKLVDAAYKLTESDSVHIRYRDKDNARLLPMGQGFYHEVAKTEWSLLERSTPAVRVIISGREEINGHATKDNKVIEFRQRLPEDAQKVLWDVESYCFLPLIFQNRCIGSLGLYKKKKNHYNEKFAAIARIIAERMGPLLHDYLVSIDRMLKDYAFDSSINALAFANLDGKINYVNQSALDLWGYKDRNEVIGKHIEEFYQSQNDNLNIIEFLLAEGSWRGHLTAIKKNDSKFNAPKFNAQVSANLVKDYSGKVIGAMASFIDITEQKRLEKVQQAIYSISEAAGSVENLDKLYPRIHKIIAGLIPAKNFYIARYDEQTNMIHYPYFIDEKEKKPSPHTAAKGMTEYVINTGEPILAPYEKVEELNRQGEIKIVGPPCIDWLGVPLITGDKTIGVLAVQTYKKGLRYTDKDKEILTFVSEQIALAIKRKAEEELRVSLSEKEALLKEIHHRVKNNLAIISNLLYLQSGTIREPQAVEYLNNTMTRVKAMALIHETLYKSENFGKIDSKEYVDNLVNYLSLTYGNIKQPIEIIADVDDIFLNIDTAIPCGLIINELVTNAFRHAFRGQNEGKITIRFKRNGDKAFTLTVTDNGSGFPGDINISQTESLGLQLVDTLTRQLDGDLNIERSGGTSFIIKFREQKPK